MKLDELHQRAEQLADQLATAELAHMRAVVELEELDTADSDEREAVENRVCELKCVEDAHRSALTRAERDYHELRLASKHPSDVPDELRSLAFTNAWNQRFEDIAELDEAYASALFLVEQAYQRGAEDLFFKLQEQR